MIIKKNIHLLIILNNNFTALGMLSYYFQNQKNYKNANIFVVIDETYEKTFLKRYDIKIILKILKIIDPKLKNYVSIKVPKTSNFNFKNLFYFLKNFNLIRKQNLNFINKISKKIDINYHEIWTGNSEIINFFPFSKKVLKFEHGLSELSKYVENTKNKFNIFIKFKRKIENLISYTFFYKKNYFFEFRLVSVFKNLINKIFKNLIDKSFKDLINIKKGNYLKTIRYLNSIYKIKPLIRKKNILINYPLPDLKNKNLEKKFNHEFSKYVKIKLNEMKIGNKYNIIIKRKPNHNIKNIFNLIKIMKKDGFNNKIIFFEKIYKTDLIVDFFIEKINPKILFTNLNSSVIVFNDLYPNRKVILTDMFVVNFIDNNSKYFSNYKDELLIFNQYKKNLNYFFRLSPNLN